jgi:LemA protein
MTGAMVAVGVVVVLVCLVPVVSYNRFVEQRQQIASAWATIDAELERRHHLVPQLVASVQAAASHERAVLVHLAEAEARAHVARADPVALSTADEQVRAAVAQVLALRESSPHLNSNANFVALQGQLSMIEDRIAAARRFYNTRVVAHNERVDAFPSNVVARNRGYTKAAYFGDGR